MNTKLYHSLLLILTGICLWILFLFEGEMANYGIYTLVSYSTHEILSLIPFFCILITIIWLFILIIKIVKYKTFKQNILIFSLLFLASFLQIGYVSSQVNQITIATQALVESINPTKGEIVISKSGEQISLECPMAIFELLETNKEYSITYQYNKNNLKEGKVNLIQQRKN